MSGWVGECQWKREQRGREEERQRDRKTDRQTETETEQETQRRKDIETQTSSDAACTYIRTRAYHLRPQGTHY